MRWIFAVLCFVIGCTTTVLADEFPPPDFNREEEAFLSITDLYAEIERRAASREAKGYAVQCAMALREVEDRIQIYGAPSSESVKNAWHTCHGVYEVVVALEHG